MTEPELESIESDKEIDELSNQENLSESLIVIQRKPSLSQGESVR